MIDLNIKLTNETPDIKSWLMVNHFTQTIPECRHFLVTISDELKVDPNYTLKDLTGMPEIIHGWATIRGCKLKSLKGVSKKIRLDFDVSYNLLEEVSYMPVYIGKDINISNNEIEKIYKFPKRIKGNINASHNKLKSTVGFGKLVNDINLSDNEIETLEDGIIVAWGDFKIVNNKLTNLKGLDYVGGYFDCSLNPIQRFENVPEYVGESMCAIDIPARYMENIPNGLEKGLFFFNYDITPECKNINFDLIVKREQFDTPIYLRDPDCALTKTALNFEFKNIRI